MNENNLNESYQAYEKTKNVTTKIIAILVSTGILVGGTLVANKKNNKKADDKQNTTTSSMSSTTIDTEGLTLTEDFDINNADEVNKRAKAIYDISDKTLSVSKIVNLIYLANGKAELIKFSSTDSTAEYRELQQLFLNSYSLLFQNLTDDSSNLLSITSESDDFKLVYDIEIFTYMLLAKSNDDKVIAINFAKTVNKQLEAINNKKEEDFQNNANEFYEIAKSIIDSKDMDSYAKWLLINDIKAKVPLYSGYLTKEQKEYINKAYTVVNNKVGVSVADELGLEIDANNAKQLTTTPVGDKYNSSDAKKANAKEGTTKKLEQTTVVSEGGKKVSTSQKVIKTAGTTRVETKTFVAEVNEKTGQWTVVEKGGEVVSEKYVDSDAEAAKKLEEETTTTTTHYSDADSNTKIVVDEGGKSLN